LTILNGRLKKRSSEPEPEYHFRPNNIDNVHDVCGTEVQPHVKTLSERSIHPLKYQMAITPGYKTSDDFGNDGDDTVHAQLPYYPQPMAFAANASFPANGSLPKTVDLVFLSFFESAHLILPALLEAGANYSSSDIALYLPTSFSIGNALIEYAKLKWGQGIENCSI
jgi:hypothetical protein